MKRRWFALFGAMSLAVVGVQANAQDLPDFAKKAGCAACHAVDKKVVGPAWAWVAHRYKGNPDARKIVKEQMVKGGKGKWTEYTGGVPMPPYGPRTDEATRDKLADFILGLDPIEPPKK
ncbi:MAG: c-type cytochrome [Gammaproteobacteria bacterium]|jgi:cytochrome c